jgi:DNA-directed RNA polymerase subunit M/transcription elongation factor TFIIS
MKKVPTSIRNYCGRCNDIKNFMFLKTDKIKGLGELVVFECNKCGEQQNIFRKDLNDVINNFNKWEKNKKLEDTKKEEIEQQYAENIKTFEELKKNKPTIQWVQNDEDGEFFTKENIDATNEVLDTYIDNLVKLSANSSKVEIMKAVKEVVIKINELNDKYHYFIETIEREDLYEFIDTAAKIAGLESEDDITEEWREW